MIRYRLHIESPWAGCDVSVDLEFDEEPSQAELDDCLMTEYANSFPAGYWRIDENGDDVE